MTEGGVSSSGPKLEEIHLQDLAVTDTYPPVVSDLITWRADDLKLYLRGCVDAPPNLEGMLKWGKSQGIAPVLNPSEYTFVSHMHDAAYPNRMGQGQLDSICQLDGNLWLDFTSMFQGQWSGYSYMQHTKPVVETLHSIMLQSSQQAVVLSGYETDPLGMTKKMRDAFKNLDVMAGKTFVHEGMAELDRLDAAPPATGPGSEPGPSSGSGPAASAVHPASECEGEPREGNLTAFQRLIAEARAALEAAELPYDKYFSRLWCYVERLAVRGARPSRVLNGRGGANLEPLLLLLGEIKARCLRLAVHLGLDMNATYTVLHPWLFQRRAIRDAVRDVQRALSSLAALWGIAGGGVAGAGTQAMDPWTAVETLDCYCDADRVVVYRIECAIRGVPAADVRAVDFCACLQLAMGTAQQKVPAGAVVPPAAAEGEAGGSATTVLPTNRAAHAGTREAVGRVRKLTALDVAMAEGHSLDSAVDLVLADAAVFWRWVDAARLAGDVEVHVFFWSLIGALGYSCLIYQRRSKRHLRLQFVPARGNQPAVWKLMRMREGEITWRNTVAPHKRFNPTTNTDVALRLCRGEGTRAAKPVAIR